MRKRAKGDNKIEDFQFFDSDAEFNSLLKKKFQWIELNGGDHLISIYYSFSLRFFPLKCT